MKNKTRVFVVDDSAVVRQVLTSMINGTHDMEVIGSAQDPIFALKKFDRNWPDVITLDIEMPRMDGLTFLRKIMTERPTPVIMCSTLAAEGSKQSIEALRLGAIDVIEKPKENVKQALPEYEAALLGAIRIAAKSRVKKLRLSKRSTPLPLSSKNKISCKETADVILKPAAKDHSVMGKKLIVIGSSTGGTQALEELFTNISTRHIPPVLVVQHMPENFTRTFACRLDSISTLKVVEAQDGMVLRNGVVYIAAGGKHLLVQKVGKTMTTAIRGGPRVNRHCPSVDVLFRSAAKVSGRSTLAIIMTGMGNDGTAGMSELKAQDALTLGQNEASCVVYGMPAAAKASGAIDREVDLVDLAQEIQAFARH